MILKNAGYTVKVNEERPRKGAFVITLKKSEKTKVILELTGMPRPFTKLRNTDVEEVVESAISEF